MNTGELPIKTNAVRIAERCSLRGMATMLENGQPLTDEIRCAIRRVVAAAARADLRTRSPGPNTPIGGGAR